MELYNEDCLERLKKIPDKSIDLIFNDLPYGQTSCKWDSLIDIDELWKEYKRIRKDTTPIFFTCSTKFGHSLISSNMKEFRYDLVWVKSSPCGFLNAKKMPMKKHEMIYVFYKKLPLYDLSSHTHKFLKEDITTNNDVVIYTSNSETYGNIPRPDFNGRKGQPRYEPPLPNSILEISSQRGKHSTQKPDALMEWILKYYSKENDIVLDPTMGSGSMGVACKKMNRKFIGIEKDEEIFKIAKERL